MTIVVISATSRKLLEAHVRPGHSMAPPARVLQDGRMEIDLDEEVAASLKAIDPDPDAAILVLCTTGVGRA